MAKREKVKLVFTKERRVAVKTIELSEGSRPPTLNILNIEFKIDSAVREGNITVFSAHTDDPMTFEQIVDLCEFTEKEPANKSDLVGWGKEVVLSERF